MENMEENSEKTWTLWQKPKFNSEKKWKIQKKSKLNSEKIWKIWKKIVKSHIISQFSSVFSISFHNFLPYLPCLFTIQLTFLLYFPFFEKKWKIQKKSKLNSEKIWKIWKKIVKRYGKYRRKL
jgi:hypothetical protein